MIFVGDYIGRHDDDFKEMIKLHQSNSLNHYSNDKITSIVGNVTTIVNPHIADLVEIHNQRKMPISWLLEHRGLRDKYIITLLNKCHDLKIQTSRETLTKSLVTLSMSSTLIKLKAKDISNLFEWFSFHTFGLDIIVEFAYGEIFDLIDHYKERDPQYKVTLRSKVNYLDLRVHAMHFLVQKNKYDLVKMNSSIWHIACMNLVNDTLENFCLINKDIVSSNVADSVKSQVRINFEA